MMLRSFEFIPPLLIFSIPHKALCLQTHLFRSYVEYLVTCDFKVLDIGYFIDRLDVAKKAITEDDKIKSNEGLV